ncbi:MAG TPA: YraN family protein [Xanthomonadales bacterium]|nr:YraN family protein [Xanthomonadales bacterium]
MTRTASKREVGAAHEQAAADHLVRNGLVVLARNVACRFGELDLVCRDDDTTVFVEVRYRLHRDFGGAVGSVDAHKQRRIVSAAQWYLSQHAAAARGPCRFDVVAVSGTAPYAVDWLRDAFHADS